MRVLGLVLCIFATYWRTLSGSLCLDSDTCSSSSGSGSERESDHLERDVSQLNLTSAQLGLVMQAYESLPRHDEMLMLKARATQVTVSPHLAYRYLQSCEWSPQYHGRRVNDSIADTIEWRHSYGIASIDTTSIAPLVQQRLAWASQQLDRRGRAIVYMHAGHDGPRLPTETYVRLLMYTVERADKHSVAHGNGEFVTVVNLAGFSWTKVPPLAAMTESIGLLKRHYPYRLGAVYVVNAGFGVDMLWGLFKPLIPARALRKIFFLPRGDAGRAALDEHIGLDNLEAEVGGRLDPEPLAADGASQRYFDAGHWAAAAAAAAVHVSEQTAA